MQFTDLLHFLHSRGGEQIALCGSVLPAQVVRTDGVTGFIAIGGDGPSHSELAERGLAPLTVNDAAAGSIDAVIVVDEGSFPLSMRALEPLARRDAIIVPLNPDWIVPQSLREMTAMELAWQTTADVNYASRSGLRGHYVEFGTFWGRSFFPAYFRYRGWLDGRFYAFDSFAGLSTPLDLEVEYTAGDFSAGAYACNRRTFEAVAALLAMPPDRLVVVDGFYAETLVERDPAQYGLDDESVSVCVIDCDLREPTAQVLEFVTPLLQPGALVYFDDWRLCRASRKVGERAAALSWLSRHPNFELVELHRDSWQHQWFIFQREA
jgi:hypothetical protein